MERQVKESNIQWIGSIPVQWELTKVKHLFNIGRGRVISQLELTDSGYPVYSSQTKNNGCLGYISTYDFDRSQLTWTTDGANAGTVFLREGKHNCTNVCGTLMPKNGEHNLKFLKYALEFIAIYHKRADINGYKIMNNEMAEILITLPPRREQDAIALFLDRKCAEIDAVIEKTKATIEEYKKLKQSIITEAVTKGIRGDRPMKDSGIEWIGEIPVNWNIRKMKCMFRIKKNIAGQEGYTVLSITQKGIVPKNLSSNEGQLAENYSHYQLVEPGDFAMNHMDLLTGWVDISKYRGVTSPDYRVFVMLDPEKNCSKFILYLMQMCYTNRIFYGLGQGVSGLGRWRLQSDKFLNFTIPVPFVDEQKEIADYLDKKCAEIDSLIAKKTNLLSELENYKKSLIYEYVTGKKECSEIIKDTSENTCLRFPAVINASSPRFAQAVLMSKILDECRKNIGSVKLEKMLFTIEYYIGFMFDTEYVREVAGPLDASLYKSEAIISKKNKWYIIDKSKRPVSYIATKNKNKYKKYYDRYFAKYDAEINRIIDIFKPYTTDQAEIIATLFAAWNDAIIDGNDFSDEDIVNDVLNNWNDSKKRFSKDVWLRALDTMRKNNLIPKGYGKKTVIKGKTV